MKHDNIVKIPKQALVIDVPVDKIDNDIKQNYNIIYMENKFSDEEMGLSTEEKFAKCDDLINKVISSEIVITSRLHVLTVCLANGVRVQFVGNEHISDKDSCYYSKKRYEGITDLIDNPELISVVQKQIENNIISSIYNKYYKNAAL
jgi:exopolysaccharide biosynthesis predicted pyruvyltransferase EpsI